MPTLKQIQDKVKRLQAQAEALIAKQGKTVLADIRKLMDDHGLTIADIEAHAATKKRAGRPAGGASAKVAKGKAATRPIEATASTSAKGKLPPKYRDPKTGATWSGHARPPAWIAKVRDRTKFLIDGASGAVSANGVRRAKTALNKTSAAAGAVARKGHGKGALPAKYRDPKSGATWSGRGPAPAWLAAAKDRTKFLVDGVAAAPASGAVAKKAVASQTVAKKASAASAKKSSVKTAAKKAPVSSAKSIAGKKAAKPAVKKVAKSNVASKAVAAKKAATPSDATVAPASAAAPEAVSAPTTL
ncbi:histone family protein nucleoid-structuring protein H-NS [Caballeronia choica]|uniref:Histone family protein nucleoid-structuring protein H-NS n=1 Tax=Caballeronia choica TaxID=326476 RepID=A0A158KV88_9BURK|nr:H-NS histone family protein [Caballeronia choica]SAL85014.1 histone family protein nucleoid-structuring protein H-NS [Caballeronia choica]